MKGISRLALVLAWVVVAAVIVPGAALAFEQRSGDSVTVSDDVADDLYVFGSAINITGNIKGDVVAFGQSITVSGDVSGNVIAAGSTVRVTGPVGGSVRAAGQDVEIAAAVGGDVLLAGSTVRVIGDGAVGRDAVLGGGMVSLDGPVKRNVLAGAGTMTIASAVGGDVNADVGTLAISKAGSVGGNLTYYSDTEAKVQGEVAGQTQRHPARNQQDQQAPKKPSFAALAFTAALAWLQSFIGIALFGGLAVLMLRGFAVVAADEVFGRPLPSLGIGVAVLASALPVAGFVFVVGLFIGAWWIAFVLMTLVWLLALVGLVIGALATGRWLLARAGKSAAHPILACLLGLLVIWLLGLVPFAGWLAGFAAMLLGMGAIVMAAYGRPRTASIVEPMTMVPPASPPMPPPGA